MANNLDQVNSVNSDSNGNGNNNSIPRVCVTYCHFPQDSLELINQVWPNYLNFIFDLIAFKFGPGSSVKLRDTACMEFVSAYDGNCMCYFKSHNIDILLTCSRW